MYTGMQQRNEEGRRSIVIESSDDFASDPQTWDLIVVGAGVAGSSMAASQAKEGRKILLLERDLNEPDRIVGELLQPGGYMKLKELGMEDCLDDIDSQRGVHHQVYGYCLFKNNNIAKLPYPLEKFDSDVSGRSFHNGRFVQKLRHKASIQPGVVIREATAKQLLKGDGNPRKEGEPVGGVLYKLKDGTERTAFASMTVICEGMYSNLRDKICKPDICQPSCFVGLVLENCTLPVPNYGHVVLAKPSPILFYPISSNEVRCLIDYPGSKLPPNLKEYIVENIVPQMPQCLRLPIMNAVKHGNIRSIINKSMPAVPSHQVGALLLGDAFNMRHPLTGGGMTVALSDTKLLSSLMGPLPSLNDRAAMLRMANNFFCQRRPLSATVNTLADALYKVFSASDSEIHEKIQDACFDYLRLGGWFSEGPILLLSGLKPKPIQLLLHFYAVAIYGIGRLLLPRPTFKGIYQSMIMLYLACGIILPILKSNGLGSLFH